MFYMSNKRTIVENKTKQVIWTGFRLGKLPVKKRCSGERIILGVLECWFLFSLEPVNVSSPDTSNSFPCADGPTWKHPVGYPGYQERHGCYRAGFGPQWPKKYHVNLWQLKSAVPQSGLSQAQLWPERAGPPYDSEEEPATEAGFSVKNHNTWPHWCKLYWQMVTDHLSNSFFFFQHCLLALLCKLRGKASSARVGTNSNMYRFFLHPLCFIFIFTLLWYTKLSCYIPNWSQDVMELNIYLLTWKRDFPHKRCLFQKNYKYCIFCVSRNLLLFEFLC